VNKFIIIQVDAHLVLFTGEVRCCAVSADGKAIATGGIDMAVKVWDLRQGTLLGEQLTHTAPVSKVAFSPDNNQLVSTSLDGTVAFYQTW